MLPCAGGNNPTGGSLIIEFATPVTSLTFDFVLPDTVTPVTDGLSVTFKNDGNDVADLLVPANPAGGHLLGSLAYSGAEFNQVTIFFSLDAPTFNIAELSYEPVPDPTPPHPGFCGMGTAEFAVLSLTALMATQGRRRRVER